MPITGGIIGGGLLVGAVGNIISGNKTANAAKNAQQATAEQIALAQEQAKQGAAVAQHNLLAELPGMKDNLDQGYLQSQDALTQGLGQQRQDLLSAGSLGTGALAQGQTGALSALYNGATQGVGYLGQAQSGVDTAINSGANAAGNILGNRQDRAGALLDQPGGLYGNYQQSPGYQFAQQQGEQAIARQNAASGGRYSGAALKEISQFNNGLANQDYQNFVQNQNSLYGANANSDAQSLQAGGQLANIYAQGASQLGSAQQALGSQAAGLAAGTGQNAANTISGTAGQLANTYAQTGTQLASQAGSSAGALAGNANNYYNGLNNLDWNGVTTLNQYGLGAAGVPLQTIGANAANNASTTQYAGTTAAALGQLGQGAAQLGALASAYPKPAQAQGGAYGGGAAGAGAGAAGAADVGFNY